jgi:hypothetical protein
MRVSSFLCPLLSLMLAVLVTSCASSESFSSIDASGGGAGDERRDTGGPDRPDRPDRPLPPLSDLDDAGGDPDDAGDDASAVDADTPPSPPDGGPGQDAAPGVDASPGAPDAAPGEDTPLPTPQTGCCVFGCGEAPCAACEDTCEPGRLIVNRTCQGCTGPGAEGTCGGGDVLPCNAEVGQCTTVSCGGVTRYCTQVDGLWQWRTTPACDDGEACTESDRCQEGVCRGNAYTCPALPCGADRCEGTTLFSGPASCTTQCTGNGGCTACTCEQAPKACAAGAGNQCCVSLCDPIEGCRTAPGPCVGSDVCTNPNTLFVGASCQGCGTDGAEGFCGAPDRFECSAASPNACQQVPCGGQTYTCSNVGGAWQWRNTAVCDDGDLCTHTDTCQAGLCRGTPVVCTDTDCAIRTCNGTATCASTPRTGASCDDGNVCTGPDACTAGGVCGGGPAVNRCGDGTCNCGETNATCAADCPVLLPPNACVTGTQSRRGCGNARTVSRASVLAGFDTGNVNMCTGSNSHSGECGGLFDVGFDETWAIYVRAGERVDATLTAGTTRCTSDQNIHTRLKFKFHGNTTEAGARSCPVFNLCVGGPRRFDTTSTTRTFTADQDGWLFVIVDSGATAFDEGRGHYRLQLQLRGCTTPNCGC